MFSIVRERTRDLLHLFFPHQCAGCGSDILAEHEAVCPLCLLALPETKFTGLTGNPVEKTFYGRLSIRAGMSSYYFTKDSVLQQLIHALKYNHTEKAGLTLGICMGRHLLESTRFAHIDTIIPVPLHPTKEKQRGYNQSTVLGKGIALATGWYLCEYALIKKEQSDTQTHKGRGDRWENVKRGFQVLKPEAIMDRHLLLLDDVLTTGATLEACGSVIQTAKPASLSIATLAWAGG